MNLKIINLPGPCQIIVLTCVHCLKVSFVMLNYFLFWKIFNFEIFFRFWNIFEILILNAKNRPVSGKANKKENTHDWNYDKPYEWEWGLETLTGKTFVKNKLFWGGRKFVSKGNPKSKLDLDFGVCHYWWLIVHTILWLM